MKHTITEMSSAFILGRGMQLLFSRFGTFVAIELIVNSPVLALQLALPEMAINPRTATIMAVLPMALLRPIGTAAMLRVIMQEYLGEPIGLGEALRFAASRFAPLFITSLLAGLGIMVGLVLCCIPGIYLAIAWSMISQVVVMENLSGQAALTRSKSLVEEHILKVFGILLLLIILVGIVNFGVNTVLTAALPFAEVVPVPIPFELNRFEVHLTSYLNFAISEVAALLVNTLGESFTAICTTLLYFDLRNRKESFNIESIAAWSNQYRTRRDEPDVVPPAPGGPASPEQTGIKEAGCAPALDTEIKPTDGTAPPPGAGIKNPGAEPPKPSNDPPPP